MASWLEDFMDPLVRVKKLGGFFSNKFGIGFGEFFLMKQLYDNAGILGVEKNLRVSKAAISQMLGALEKKGYIIREINIEDRRKIQAKLTAEGVNILCSTKEAYNRSFDEIVTKFGTDNALELIRLLSRFADIIEEKRENII